MTKQPTFVNSKPALNTKKVNKTLPTPKIQKGNNKLKTHHPLNPKPKTSVHSKYPKGKEKLDNNTGCGKHNTGKEKLNNNTGCGKHNTGKEKLNTNTGCGKHNTGFTRRRLFLHHHI
jgi:hypothetical protein